MPDEEQVRYAEANLRDRDAEVDEGLPTRAVDGEAHLRVRRDELPILRKLVLACNLQRHRVHVEEAAADDDDGAADDADVLDRVRCGQNTDTDEALEHVRVCLKYARLALGWLLAALRAGVRIVDVFVLILGKVVFDPALGVGHLRGGHVSLDLGVAEPLGVVV